MSQSDVVIVQEHWLVCILLSNENDDFISFASLLMSKKLNGDVFRGWTFGGHISESNQARKFIFDKYRHLGFMHKFVQGAN